MVRYLVGIAIALWPFSTCFAQSYGLEFNSHETVLEKRTALDLSPDDSFCLAQKFDLEFDFSFRPNHSVYFGFIVRLICGGHNLDLMYNQPTRSFQVISGEHFSGVGFTVDSAQLYREWIRIRLSVDLETQRFTCYVNNKAVGTDRLPEMKDNCFRFLWGANDFRNYRTRDIPPMKVKDIRIIEDKTAKYYWPLDEKTGDTPYDRINHKAAKVKNPVWAKPKYQNWENISSFTVNGYAGVAFDPRQDKLFITGADSMGILTFGKEQRLSWKPCKRQHLVLAHQNLYDTLHDKLLDTYIDHKKITTYNFTGAQWNYTFPEGPVRATEFWHANKFIAYGNDALYYIGGYGFLRYKNLVQRYRFATQQWDTLQPGGDYLPPKYLSALGTDPQGKFAYILGGYGSQTGDQMLDPHYYYDLFRYDVQQNTFKKLYSFKPISTSSTFANSLVMDASSNAFYGLIFSNESYNSSLQLVKGSLNDSTLSLLGNTIPYNFHDVQSYADLYYSPGTNQLIAVTLFYSPVESTEYVDANVKNTQVNIYTIHFPPEPPDGMAKQEAPAKAERAAWPWYILIGGAGIVALLLLFRKRLWPSKPALPVQEPAVAAEVVVPTVSMAHQPVHSARNYRSAIFFFGHFQVFDKEGNDITRLFTPLLKELFLTIAIHTFRNGRGITSEGLNEILWYDKPEKDANNNRSVNLAKLKTILEKIGNGVISREAGYWQYVRPDDQIMVDYAQYVALIQSHAKPGIEFITALREIIERGPFLSQTEYKWLDNVKSEVSNAVVDNCLAFINNYGITKDPEFIIDITNYIFNFDPLNEDALAWKCKSLILLKRHTLANNYYQTYVREYKEIYGEDYGKSLHDLIA